MTEIVAFPLDGPARAGPFHPLTMSSPVDLNGTLGLIQKAAETIHRLQSDNAALHARAEAAVAQVHQDRAGWEAELRALDQEAESLQGRVAATEAQLREAEAAVKSAAQRYLQAEARELAALKRAEAAEDRARTAEEWLLRLQDAITVEFSEVSMRAAS